MSCRFTVMILGICDDNQVDVAAAHGELFSTVDPGSGERLAEVCAMQPEDVDQAVQAAAAALRTRAF